MSRQAPVLTRAVRKFLKTPRIARLATIGRDGYPHLAPMNFELDGDDIVFGSDDNERKVWNSRRNPKGAVLIGGDPETDDAGYLIQGDLSVEPRDAADGATEIEWGDGAQVTIRLKPQKVIRVW